VVARQPRWEGAWNGLGWSQYCARQYQLALEAFQEAVSLDPTYRDGAVGLAYALFELGRYREALPHLHRLTREGWIRSAWRTTENNRRARYYALTRAGEDQLGIERETWARLSEAVERIMGTA